MDDDRMKLDNQLCFALYVCSKEIIKKYKPLLDPLELTYTSYITMLALWEKDDVNVKELGKRLFLDSGTLTPLLKKLEKCGYIQRIRSSSDERNVNILLTTNGKMLKERASHVPRELICSSTIDPKKAKGLMQTLHELMKELL